MTAPKKRGNLPPQIKSVVGGDRPFLTREESAILATYRAMDDKTREFAAKMMRSSARNYPRAPRLRLVSFME